MEKKRKGGGVAAVTLAAAAMLLFTRGPGLGLGDGMGIGNAPADVPTPPAQVEQTQSTTQRETQPETAPVEKRILLVTVAENDYLYENQKYDLNGLMACITAVEGEFVVEIREDNASLRAVRDLTDSLAEVSISYIQ